MHPATAILLALGLTGCTKATPGGVDRLTPAGQPDPPSGDLLGRTGDGQRVSGSIRVTELPPNRGVILNLALFRVESPSSPPPYDGDPPADSITDVVAILEDVDLARPESTGTERLVEFEFRRPPGDYYVQVRAVVFRSSGDRMVAQAEQFFFGRRPLSIGAAEVAGVEFPVVWPAMPVEDLGVYGTVRPNR
jgi:hypothetical protein